MNLAATLRLYAQSAGTGSEAADSPKTDAHTKKRLKKAWDHEDALRRKVGPRGEDRNAKRKALRAKNDLDPAEDMDTERLKDLKKKRQRLCTVCAPGGVPGRNITGGGGGNSERIQAERYGGERNIVS